MKFRIIKKKYRHGKIKFIPQYKKFLFYRNIPYIDGDLNIYEEEGLFSFSPLYFEYYSIERAKEQIERYIKYCELEKRFKSIKNMETVYQYDSKV